MDTLRLYPKRAHLIIGVVLGLVFLSGGLKALSSTPPTTMDDLTFVHIVGLLSVFLGGQSVIGAGMRIFRPRPVFEADSDGFQVLGKTKRPWDQFKGAEVQALRIYYVFTILQWVTVRVGRSRMFASNIQIKWIYMPDSAKNTVAMIEMFAVGVITQDAAQTPKPIDRPPFDILAAPVRPTAVPVDQNSTFAPRPNRPANASTAGLIKEVPTLGQRLFGRKTVI